MEKKEMWVSLSFYRVHTYGPGESSTTVLKSDAHTYHDNTHHGWIWNRSSQQREKKNVSSTHESMWVSSSFTLRAILRHTSIVCRCFSCLLRSLLFAWYFFRYSSMDRFFLCIATQTLKQALSLSLYLSLFHSYALTFSRSLFFPSFFDPNFFF